MKKKALSWLLVLTLMLGLLPVSALAAEGDPDTEMPVVCAELEGCTEGTHAEGCPLYETPKEPAEEVEEPIPADSAVTALQERIDALPDADTLEEMDKETQTEVYEEICAISDAIDKLADEEAGALDMSALKEAAAFFTRQTMMLGEPEVFTGNLDLAGGSITITATGYTQGDAEAETAYTGSYVITQSGSTTANGIIIKGVTDEKTVTLNGINISRNGPGVDIQGDTTLLLAGQNTIKIKDNQNFAGIYIAQNKTLTIDNGSDNGIGELTVAGRQQSPGIGCSQGKSCGSIIINGGRINASGYQYGAAIGSGVNNASCPSITINGGIVHTGMSSQCLKASSVTVTGGWIDAPKISTAISSNNITVTGGSLTKGKDTYGDYSRVICAFGKDGENLANSEVTVTVGAGADATTWSASTDSYGILYAYFPSTAETVSVQVPGETTARTLTLKEDNEAVNPVFSGISCVCGTKHGTLTMETKSQSLTTVNGEASLSLSASYTPSESCNLPMGYHFHGAYEENAYYEIVSVTRNGQFVTADRYAAISGNTLTVYGDADQDTYTVKVRAVVGSEDDPIYSGPITVKVGTYVYDPVAEEGELDIGLGSILITETGYSQGILKFTNGTGFSVVDADGAAVQETNWGKDENHTLTIVGSSISVTSAVATNHIVITGGAPVITLKDVSITMGNGNTGVPAVALISGTSSAKNIATLVLSGENTLTGGPSAPAVQINKYAALTIQGDGSLTATGKNTNPGIGASSSTTYAIDPSKKTVGGNYRAGGELVIESGTVTSAATAGTAGLGTGYENDQTRFGKIEIKGGTVKTDCGKLYKGIYADNISISGGVVETQIASGKNSLYAKTSISVSGGTMNGVGTFGGASGYTVSITGGNINGHFTGEETNSRVLTKLYFVNEDGSPVANTEVSVTEGTGDSEKTWTALTNDKGVITTYFASGTDSISVSYGDKQNVSVTLGGSHQALIGGDCSCSNFAGITWDSGLPSSVTLYDENGSTYSVADAVLAAEGDCPMPIHPNLTAITYSLSVTANGNTVDEDSVSTYAALENGTLTLKPANAPYTVTLTATAGEKTAAQTIQVLKGASDEGVTTIDLSKGNVVISYNSDSSTYSYTQGSSEDSTTATGSILLTGDAASATVTVNGGSPTLTVNQNSVDDVWAIYASDEATDLTLDAQTINGKVRFGAVGSLQAEMSYISADKVKLNPDSGDITFNAAGGVQQGKFTVSALDKREISAMGADTEADRTITNSRSEALTLTVNNEEVSLESGGTYTIEKALGSEQNSSGTMKTYLLSGGDSIYEHYTVQADGNKSYEVCTYGTSSTSENNLVEGYRLLIIAEGDGNLGGYGFANKVVFEKGSDTYTTYYTNSRITDVIIDEDLTGTLYASGVLYGVNLKELHAESVGDIVVYTSTLGDLYLGENLSNFTWGNYCTTTSVHVPESNPHFAVDDAQNGGVLYTKDFSTLLLIPAMRTAAYSVREECTTIKANATMQCHVGVMTIGKNVSYIGGTYIFFSNWVSEFCVESGNKYFVAKNGILYSADMTRMVAYPRAREDTVLTIPSTVTYVESLILAGTPIETLIVEEGANITGDQVGLGRISGLKEVILNGNYAGQYQWSYELEKLTVPDGFNFSRNLNDCSMGWISENISNKWTGKITVSGVSKGENIPYDEAAHGITVTTTAENATVEYSTDGVTYSETAPTYTEPGTYTIYWRITKAADDNYEFARELHSSRTFTISALEASEDWFTLNTVGTSGTNPVTLSQPAAAPSLENGYTVKYSKDGTGEATKTAPTEAGKYLVTVDITADGYAKETLILGYYTILSDDQSGSVVLSFITYGGNAIEPLIWETSDTNGKDAPDDPTRNGYTFAGWYTDTSLRTEATLGEDGTISKPNESATWYAKWTRNTYSIAYTLTHENAINDNPTTYTVESPTFTLNAPVLAGYLFKGWKAGEEADPSTSVTIEHGSYGNKAYTAEWELIQYTITYDSYTSDITGNPTSYTVEDIASKGLSLTAPAAREGYTFSGWQMTVDGVAYVLPAENAEIPQGTVGNIVLSGIWLAEGQTLTLNANGGAFTDGQETMTISADYASSITLTQPTRSGYDFAGWYTDEDCETAFEASTMPLSTTIYAKWTSSLSISPDEASFTGSGTVTLTVENAVGDVSVSCSDASISVSGSGNTWTATLPNKDATYTFAVSAENGTVGCTVTVTYKSNGGGGSSSGSSTYTVTVDSGKNGTVSVSPKSASKGTTVTITVKPDSGYELDDLTVTDKNGNEVKLTKKSDTQYTFTMPASKVTVEASFAKIEEQPEIAFVDVSTSAYYYDAVAWAVENGVTSGTSATTFSPDAACTRAQAVTFLWRAAGSPAPKSSVNPFTDVPASAYYYNAVLWAVEQGITVGTSATTFSPDAACTRGQIVTFLFRAVGTTTNGANPFVDVADSAYYADAVKWAVAENVTAGTSATTFSPDASCTRAQIVTFLYRAYA